MKRNKKKRKKIVKLHHKKSQQRSASAHEISKVVPKTYYLHTLDKKKDDFSHEKNCENTTLILMLKNIKFIDMPTTTPHYSFLFVAALL